ncbi:hypothetical protein Anas_00062 [Armadillidium nasatum]|uniref:Uncharacterized protein n=1 Tax=Armadillidium nasatum TaxID=96803 RepID=A0A5N5TL79_9CRUS|nr:hypothetical protein Anas_00062 [Armadillidium nasatum]
MKIFELMPNGSSNVSSNQFSLSNALMIGDYATPGSLILPTQEDEYDDDLNSEEEEEEKSHYFKHPQKKGAKCEASIRRPCLPDEVSTSPSASENEVSLCICDL